MHSVGQLFCKKNTHTHKDIERDVGIRLLQFISELTGVAGSYFLSSLCACCALYFQLDSAFHFCKVHSHTFLMSVTKILSAPLLCCRWCRLTALPWWRRCWRPVPAVLLPVRTYPAPRAELVPLSPAVAARPGSECRWRAERTTGAAASHTATVPATRRDGGGGVWPALPSTAPP